MVTQIRATDRTGRRYSAASSVLQIPSSISLAMTREAVHAILQGMLDRLEARKELAIAKVARNWSARRTWPKRKRS